MPYIEIKTRNLIDSSLVKKLIAKETISAILTTGKITKPAKELLDEYDIAWAENIPENEFMESENLEES